MRCIFEVTRASCPYKGRDLCNLFEVLARQRVPFDPLSHCPEVISKCRRSNLCCPLIRVALDLCLVGGNRAVRFYVIRVGGSDLVSGRNCWG